MKVTLGTIFLCSSIALFVTGLSILAGPGEDEKNRIYYSDTIYRNDAGYQEFVESDKNKAEDQYHLSLITLSGSFVFATLGFLILIWYWKSKKPEKVESSYKIITPGMILFFILLMTGIWAWMYIESQNYGSTTFMSSPGHYQIYEWEMDFISKAFRNGVSVMVICMGLSFVGSFIDRIIMRKLDS